jgi:chemosensory pili system protein ChpA (sensor histidine kinase/response regulator)
MSEWWEDAPKVNTGGEADQPADDAEDSWWLDAPLADNNIPDPDQAPLTVNEQPQPSADDWWSSAPVADSKSTPQPVDDGGDSEPSLFFPDEDSLMHDSVLIEDSQLMPDTGLLGDSGLLGSSGLTDSQRLNERSSQTTSTLLTFNLSDHHAAVPVAKKEVSREQVRVNADQLDKLVNNAGEVSIFRTRLEQQNSTMGFNLSEMEQTIDRLQTQLRQLEIETEAQILFRYERDNYDDLDYQKDFDPLELDRFSTIQELSRSLSETVNDLTALKTSMFDLARETDTLLLQQSRINTDLQEGLLHTRMVPISQQMNRLQRVVRQTAQTLGKKAALTISGTVDEMDRTILDNIMGPLEHLLRNAVGHGLENPQDRIRLGKPDEGGISLQLDREGNEILIRVADDGRGLNLDSIRKKAISVGLMNADSKLPDETIMQFILEPGFSTATEVTQISGRGVGMDVVTSEIKQLGGNLEIDSQTGKGTSFNIRLPYTLAISDAMLVRAGDETYAIPHTAIEGVTRISREQVETCLRDEDITLDYAEHTYRIRNLARMLGVSQSGLEQRRWFPVMLVRSGENRVALQIEQLLGNRQIVVKSVGPQLSSVRWISGGTILGDGSVALILDVNALIRTDLVHRSVAPMQEEDTDRISVMVVDDSITVRKVTSRLLARHNMDVVTAKDGVDALEVLQDVMPSVILLDIEMPRMDGFELARHLKNSDEFASIPIIMITSRTGDKHRRKAMELGVNSYLGKPYQEDELLENIYIALAEVGA